MSATAETPKIWTEAELQSLSEAGYIHEVVNGELVMSPKNDWFHGRICSRLLVAIGNFVSKHRLGAVLDSSTGFWMHNGNCRAPDVFLSLKAACLSFALSPMNAAFFPARQTWLLRFCPRTIRGG